MEASVADVALQYLCASLCLNGTTIAEQDPQLHAAISCSVAIQSHFRTLSSEAIHFTVIGCTTSTQMTLPRMDYAAFCRQYQSAETDDL